MRNVVGGLNHPWIVKDDAAFGKRAYPGRQKSERERAEGKVLEPMQGPWRVVREVGRMKGWAI